ncbi:glycosyltransferase family 2 protein [Nocardia sp. CC227C]|uniref:glycosyltransferase family 2 protein n=1 Tax=Nocardia sp. CC227C TaxID=3044562 RepID=UPI00278BBEAC|nr:glycosyltransferase family 2 protein [Nocardia sp. CC227C]
MDLAVCTSCWGDYGQYLPAWASSIADQTVKPAQAVIADLGITNRQHLRDAVDILTAAGITTLTATDSYRGMGAARNYAVRHSTAEWVMHLDADDVLLPHAVADTAALAAEADVVALGAVLGDGERCFPHVTRELILGRGFGCYSCSPFRRSLWERRPWHTRNDWIDSVFWVGLAHLGARFRGTVRPGFIYRQHPGSFSHRLSPVQRRAAAQQWKAACRQWSLT